VHSMHTLGGPQNVSFLTEKGQKISTKVPSGDEKLYEIIKEREKLKRYYKFIN
jgi:hypothetical protein